VITGGVADVSMGHGVPRNSLTFFRVFKLGGKTLAIWGRPKKTNNLFTAENRSNGACMMLALACTASSW
jgi:uncharacterized membrane protein YfbV (UPF0208 family)